LQESDARLGEEAGRLGEDLHNIFDIINGRLRKVLANEGVVVQSY
jgi:hypothetical protein